MTGELVAQVSKPAELSSNITHGHLLRPADLEVGDTAGLETCATVRVRLCHILLLISFLAIPASAVSPQLNSISPPGGQQGTEVELTFSGNRLQDTAELVFYRPGIEFVKFESLGTNGVKARVKIAADCAPGEHQIRLRATNGVSQLRTFYVGPFPNVAETEPNNDRDKAQKLTTNITVNATGGGEDLDWYLVDLKAGQRLSVEIEAMRLGRGMLDPRIIVQNNEGAVLAEADDTPLLSQDAAVTFLVPKEDTYYIQVRETSFSGSADSAYRLHVGTFPRPMAVYPPGGQTGETLELRFIGDAAGEFTNALTLPSITGERYGVMATRDGQPAPSPNWLRVSTFTNVLEQEPNNAREQAAACSLTPPLALNGILAQPGDVDWFRFKADKGQALEVSVWSRRLRSPLDSVLQVFDAKGNSLAQNDDAAGADSSLKFTPGEAGDYYVQVRDQLKGGAPDYFYRVEVTPVSPHVVLSIPQVERNDSQGRQFIAVPRGNRFATLMGVKRNNFSGDLKLDVEGLPRGVALHADTMAAKIDTMPLVFEAGADAPIEGKLLEPRAQPAETNKALASSYRHQLEFIPGPNNTFYYQTQVDKLYVAVTEAVPFKIQIQEPAVPLVQAGSMDLKILAERQAGFEEPIQVKMLWNPPGIGSVPEVTIPKGATSTLYRLNASGGADVRQWKIAVLGSATVQGGSAFVASQLAALDVAEPYVTGKIEAVAVSPGNATNLVCKLEQKKPFEGKATLRLIGLPEKVAVNEVQISKDDKEVKFELKVDPKCPTGSHKNLFCALDIRQGEWTIPHTLAPGGVVRIVPPKEKTEQTKLAAKGGK